MNTQKIELQQKMWWTRGELNVEVLKTGHFPTKAIVKLHNGHETEVDIDELRVKSA